LTQLTHLVCGEHFRNLLRKAADRCPNARIIAVGQYPILSSRSDIDLLHLFLKGLFIQSIPGHSFEDAFAGLPLHGDTIKAKVVALSILFWKESMKANQDAVNA